MPLRRGDAAVGDTELVDQGVGVDVVEAVAGGHVGRLVGEDCGEVGVFAVEVDEVGAEVSLLEQEAGAREVVDPGTGLFGPGFVAIEPLAEGSEGQSGRLANQRLVGRLVNDEAVDAVEELLVGGGLEGRGRPGPGRGGGGHGFGGGEVLTVDVGDRSGLAIVGVVAELLLVDAGRLGPHGAHGHFVELLDFHAVGDKGAAALVGFAVVAHAALMQRGFQLAVVFVGDQVGDGLAEVPEEAVAGFGAFHHVSGEDGHPGQRIVAAALFELGDHVVGPVLRAGLPTVGDDVRMPRLPIQSAPTVSL